MTKEDFVFFKDKIVYVRVNNLRYRTGGRLISVTDSSITLEQGTEGYEHNAGKYKVFAITDITRIEAK